MSSFLISIENFYLVEIQNKENLVKKIVDSGIVKTCDELDLFVHVSRGMTQIERRLVQTLLMLFLNDRLPVTKLALTILV